jgi:hypothetical protein
MHDSLTYEPDDVNQSKAEQDSADEMRWMKIDQSEVLLLTWD